MKRTLVFAAAIVAAMPALAADPAREAILATYAAQVRAAAPAFTGFAASRGEALFRTRWAAGDARTPSCSSCHTEDPRRTGRNAKTGRPIDPLAASVNPARFTDKAEVEKQFRHDCKSVLNRECTALEKGDYITFMAGQ